MKLRHHQVLSRSGKKAHSMPVRTPSTSEISLQQAKSCSRSGHPRASLGANQGTEKESAQIRSIEVDHTRRSITQLPQCHLVHPIPRKSP